MKAFHLEWNHNLNYLQKGSVPPPDTQDRPSRHQRTLKKHIVDVERVAKHLKRTNEELQTKILKLEEEMQILQNYIRMEDGKSAEFDKINGNEVDHYLKSRQLNEVKEIGNNNNNNARVINKKIADLELQQRKTSNNLQNITSQLSNFDKLHRSMLELLENIENIENKVNKNLPMFRKEISKLEVQMSEAVSTISALKEDQENVRLSVKAIASTASTTKDKFEEDHKKMVGLVQDVNILKTSNNLQTSKLHDHILKVFAVRSSGVMGVVVKGPTETESPLNFRMEDHGPVISIKFSLDQKILAVQRTTCSVEFMNFNGNDIEAEYSQTCKRNSTVLGFVWSHVNEVALITDHGVELYLVIPEKKNLKHLKTISATVQWFVWCPTNKIALLASAHGSNLLPIVFKPGSVSKLPKVDSRMALERDVTIATLYRTPCVLIVRHYSNPQTVEVHIHSLNGPGQAPIKSHVLRLGLQGRFAINVVDNLVIVHHQASKTSQIFDISVSGENDGVVTYHTSVGPSRTIKPAYLQLPGLVEPQTHICEMYSPNWVVFQPNIVIDAKLGCLWYIILNLPELLNQITDLALCTQVALKRKGAKDVLLSIILENSKKNNPPLKKLRESFNHINKVYRNWVDEELQLQTGAPVGTPLPAKSYLSPSVLIDQDDMFKNVFQKLDADAESQKLEWVLVTYITSLHEHGISSQHSLNELLVTTLVKRNRFSTLQQMLQYGVISDSKPLACLLLSLGNMHQSAAQLALDMLSRLGAVEEIQEILLSQNQLIAALKLSQDVFNPRKFLEAAEKSKDAALFHSVLFYFKSNPQFAALCLKDERLNHYLQHYKTLFPTINT